MRSFGRGSGRLDPVNGWTFNTKGTTYDGPCSAGARGREEAFDPAAGEARLDVRRDRRGAGSSSQPGASDGTYRKGQEDRAFKPRGVNKWRTKRGRAAMVSTS